MPAGPPPSDLPRGHREVALVALLPWVLGALWPLGMGFLAGWVGALQGAIYAGAALFMITHPEFVGNFTGWTGRGYINRTTPAPIVRGIGWAMLTFPLWLTPILWLFKSCG